MSTPIAEINQETDLIGSLTNNLASNVSNGGTFTAQFVDKKTGLARAPQSTTLEYTIDQSNENSETILCSLVSTTLGITTLTIANNGRNIPKFGTGAGSNSGLQHVTGAAIGCVDIARPLNLLAQIASEKANLSGATFTGPVDFVYPSGTLRTPNLTQVQINALSATEGMILKNIDTGAEQVFLGGVWQDLGISSPTPNASTTVAGKVQMTTQATFDAGTSTGSTGAFNVSDPSVVQAGIQKGSQLYAATTGAANTYVAVLVPALTAYTTGMEVHLKINATNTGASTVNINALGAKSIVKNISTALTGGELPINSEITLRYDGTNFVLSASSSPQLTSRNGILTAIAATNATTTTITHSLGKVPQMIELEYTYAVENGTGSLGAKGAGTFDASGQSTTVTLLAVAAGQYPYPISGASLISGSVDGTTTGSQGVIGNLTTTTFDIVVTGTVAAGTWRGFWKVLG